MATGWEEVAQATGGSTHRGLCLGLAGCARVSSEAPPTPVTVSRSVKRDVTSSTDFTGRAAAADSGDVWARVPG